MLGRGMRIGSALALFTLGLAGSVTAQSKDGLLKTVTYPVADLALITPDAELVKPEDTGKTLFALIAKTVAPGTWQDRGGLGTIEYSKERMALVIRQSEEVHKQTQHLLSALRRLTEVEVALQLKFLGISDSALQIIKTNLGREAATFEQANPKQGGGEPVILNDKQVFDIMKAIQEDRQLNVMQAPKITVCNTQRAELNLLEPHTLVTNLEVVKEADRFVIRQKRETLQLGLMCSMRPLVSADRRTVSVSLKLKLTGLDGPVPRVPVVLESAEDKGREKALPTYVQRPKISTLALDRSFTVPDHQTAVFYAGNKQSEHGMRRSAPLMSHVPYINRLFTNVGYGKETQHLLVLVTPRMILNEESQPISRVEGATGRR